MLNYGIYSNNAIYRIRLMSDQELIAGAVEVYNKNTLANNNAALDSAIYGAAKGEPCKICGNSGVECTGHYALIETLFPIPVMICLDDWKKIISCICPLCSHLPLDDEGLKQLVRLPKKDRLNYVKARIQNMMRQTKDNSIVCKHCGNRVVTFKVKSAEPSIVVVPCNAENTGFKGCINPVFLKNMLQNFKQYEEAGFSKVYQPANFMTNYIPVITTKLRAKTVQNSESSMTSYYKAIIEDILPDINVAYNMVNGANTQIISEELMQTSRFSIAYSKLYAYYMMLSIPVSEEVKNKALTLMSKRDRKHYDPHNPLLGRLKGKDKSIFGQGLTYTRVNRSARTVLGGAVDASFKDIYIPYHVGQTLTQNYKVYAENINFIRQLIQMMTKKDIIQSNTIPKIKAVIKYNDNGTPVTHIITPENAFLQATKLVPGNEVLMSMVDTDLAISSRFPIVREESCTAFEVVKNDSTIITWPLSVCGMKMADFDGDEIQLYCMSGHTTDAENLLLYSTHAQFIAYKDGNPAIWYSADAPTGLLKVQRGNTLRIMNGKELPKPRDVVDIVESFLPKDLCYVDSKTEIVNGKFVGDKTNINSKPLHKYINTLYGPDVVERLMFNVTQLAYDINKDYGVTLGFDIKIYGGKDVMNGVKKIMRETYEQMCALELTNDPLKDNKIIVQTELQKPKILSLIIPAAKGSNLDNLGFLSSRQDEYYQMVAVLDHVVINGGRIKPTLAEGTRTTCNAPKCSIDPCDYGYYLGGYDSDISPIMHFYECKQQRLSIYQKGSAVSDQGYLTKRFNVAFSNIYTDYNGASIDNYRIVSSQYGSCGLNPRLYVEQPMIDINMSHEEFIKKYKGDERLIELHARFNYLYDVYRHITSFIKNEVLNGKFAAGFDYDTYINTHKVSDKGMPQATIDSFIKRLYETFCTPANEHLVKENFNQHEYYFRAKLHSVTIDEHMLDQLYEIFSWTLQDGGEPVGSKAGLACSEPLTQDVLHAIHHAGGGGATVERVERTGGVTRFKELLSEPKHKGVSSVLTISLYDDSYEACNEFVCANETIFFNNIWCDCYIGVSNSLPDFIKVIHPTINFKGADVSDYYAALTIDLTHVAEYNIGIADIIYIISSANSSIFFITGYAINDKYFAMYVFFYKSYTYESIIETLNRMTQEKSFIISGGYIRNCFIRENKNDPGHYVIECNDVVGTDAYKYILHDPRVNPYGTHSNDMRETYTTHGTCETSARHYEELIYTAINLSATSGILNRHYKVLADATYVNGEPIYADRNDFKGDRFTDTIRFVQFETAKDMIKQALKNNDINPVADPFAATVFNDIPTIGSGASKISLYEC